jgi:hypothetical protein
LLRSALGKPNLQRAIFVIVHEVFLGHVAVVEFVQHRLRLLDNARDTVVPP